MVGYYEIVENKHGRLFGCHRKRIGGGWSVIYLPENVLGEL